MPSSKSPQRKRTKPKPLDICVFGSTRSWRFGGLVVRSRSSWTRGSLTFRLSHPGCFIGILISWFMKQSLHNWVVVHPWKIAYWTAQLKLTVWVEWFLLHANLPYQTSRCVLKMGILPEINLCRRTKRGWIITSGCLNSDMPRLEEYSNQS